MVSLSKKAVAGVGGGFLIDVKTTSQYYVAKTATLNYGTMPFPYHWWSECHRNTVGNGVVTDYLTLDISGLTSGMTTPTITAQFQFTMYDLETGSDEASAKPAICKNDNSVIVEDVIWFRLSPSTCSRAFSLIADITTEKANQIKIRFKEQANAFDATPNLHSQLRMFPFITLFDAKS